MMMIHGHASTVWCDAKVSATRVEHRQQPTISVLPFAIQGCSRSIERLTYLVRVPCSIEIIQATEPLMHMIRATATLSTPTACVQRTESGAVGIDQRELSAARSPNYPFDSTDVDPIRHRGERCVGTVEHTQHVRKPNLVAAQERPVNANAGSIRLTGRGGAVGACARHWVQQWRS